MPIRSERLPLRLLDCGRVDDAKVQVRGSGMIAARVLSVSIPPGESGRTCKWMVLRAVEPWTDMADGFADGSLACKA